MLVLSLMLFENECGLDKQLYIPHIHSWDPVGHRWFSESKGHPSVVAGLPQLKTNYRVELGFYMLSDSVCFFD